MLDRVLRWFVAGEQGKIEQNVGGSFLLDDDYTPKWVFLSLKKPTKGARPLRIDITTDGVSLFDDKPALIADQKDKVWTTLPSDTLSKDSVIRLNRDQIANLYEGEDLTVELGLERT